MYQGMGTFLWPAKLTHLLACDFFYGPIWQKGLCSLPTKYCWIESENLRRN